MKRVILFVAFAGTLLCSCGGTVSTESLSSSMEKSSIEKEDEKGWEYSENIDEMTSSKTLFATIVSDNSEEFDFPYGGGSDLYLYVRTSKKFGKDVYIKISKGQFICSEYQGTNYVNVRFDEDAPMKFRTSEPSDGSADLLFLGNSTKFINRAKTAKTIKIEAPFFQEGWRVFTFTTDKPLVWN